MKGVGDTHVAEPITVTESSEVAGAIDRLVDQYRARCLWFLRPDYYPATTAERLRVLDYIQERGDLSAFRRAAELRRCLSPGSSEKSAG
jgi:hypothetical protein